MQRRFASYGFSVPWYIFLFSFSIKPLSHCLNFHLILLIFLLLFCYRTVLHQRPQYQTFRPAGNSPLHLDFQLHYNHVSRINGIYAYKRVTVHYITQCWSKYSSVKRVQNTGRLTNTCLFLSFHRVVNVIYSFLGNSPASEICGEGMFEHTCCEYGLLKG